MLYQIREWGTARTGMSKSTWLKPVLPTKKLALRAVKYIRRLNPENTYEIVEK